MNFNELHLYILMPDGTERFLRLVNAPEPAEGFNLVNAPLLVKAESGAQYKLLNIETGAHQKGQKLLRQLLLQRHSHIFAGHSDRARWHQVAE
jgi:hypothetical protein